MVQGPLTVRIDFLRCLYAGLFAVLLLVADINTDLLEQSRRIGLSIVSPLETLAKFPTQAVSWFEENTREEASVIAENQELKTRINELQAELLLLDGIKKENEYLNRVLKTSRPYQNWMVQTARVTHIPNSAFHRWVDIDKGTDHEVGKGDVILFDNILLGQVDSADSTSSRVILISDSEHQTPVRNQRTGISGILQGSNGPELPVKYMRNFSDIQEGDLMVTSGRGNLFPQSIPVARVSNVQFLRGQNFSVVNAKPLVEISSLHYVVVLSKASEFNTPAVTPTTTPPEPIPATE